MVINVKRVYGAASEDDGARILVDRLWPRGLTKTQAAIDRWLRDAAPSNELRRWFHHQPDRWVEFKRRYFAELSEKPQAIQILREAAARGPVTLLFAAKDVRRNNAVALREYLRRTARA